MNGKFATSLLILFIACFSFTTASGQKSAVKTKPTAKKASCQIGEISFACPKGFSSFFRDEAGGLHLLRSNADKTFGLFVLAPNQTAADEKEFLLKTAKAVAAKLFPKQSSDYEWKPGNVVRFGDDGTPMSTSQTRSQTFRIYNKNHLLLANFRHIEFKNRKFIVGYVAEIATGSEAADLFAEEEIASAGYETCKSQMELIYSITGEKVKKGAEPCGIMVETVPGE